MFQVEETWELKHRGMKVCNVFRECLVISGVKGWQGMVAIKLKGLTNAASIGVLSVEFKQGSSYLNMFQKDSFSGSMEAGLNVCQNIL